MRIGHGFDVHKLVKGRKLILGGVGVPFEKGLEGHSDADVLIHAVMDAILGALGANDIGTHFPDTDKKYKDISSMLLLEKVVEMMHAAKFHLGNLDVLLHADEPKIKELIPGMRKNIAKKFSCGEHRINVKATTWEGLGFAGTGEGIAASAVCLLIPDVWDEDNEYVPFGTAHLFEQTGSPGQKEKLSGGKTKAGETWVAYIDGASKGNPGPSAIGVLIRDPDGLLLAEISEAIGEATNNVAEYRAMIRALEECRLLKAENVLVRTDSQLLARQIDGKYKVKNPQLIELFDKVRKSASKFSAFKVEHIPREENKEADALANRALKKKKK